MFKIFSDLSAVVRKELDIATTGPGQPLASGVTGSWVTLNSSGKAKVTDDDYGLAWPIWNESYRDGTVGGFTPDVNNTKKVSVIYGKIFATTDQYTGTPSLGDPLKTAANGKLAAATLGTDHIVAFCVKAQYSTTYFGRTLNVIDIMTV